MRPSSYFSSGPISFISSLLHRTSLIACRPAVFIGHLQSQQCRCLTDARPTSVSLQLFRKSAFSRCFHNLMICHFVLPFIQASSCSTSSRTPLKFLTYSRFHIYTGSTRIDIPLHVFYS